MFSATTTADHWIPWLIIVLLVGPFAVFAVLGWPRAVLWTMAAETFLFVAISLAVLEWLFLMTPLFLGAGAALTATCYWLAKLSRNHLWHRPGVRNSNDTERS